MINVHLCLLGSGASRRSLSFIFGLSNILHVDVLWVRAPTGASYVAFKSSQVKSN